MVKIAFCSDCDFMTWKTYKTVHHICDDLQLAAGDSFMLFDPSHTYEMALWGENLNDKTPHHDEILSEIVAGKIDVLHGIGNFDDREHYPSRQEIATALAYLKEQGAAFNIFTCHGNHTHVHNFPRPGQRIYQKGDLPFSQYYVADLLDDFGVKFFWASELHQNLQFPTRIVHRVLYPDGRTRNNFLRFGQWRENVTTMSAQFNPEYIKRAIELQQNIIFFTHWDAPKAYPANAVPLAVAGFEAIAKMRDEGLVEVVPLTALLEEESRRTQEQEAHRVATGILKNYFDGINWYYGYTFVQEQRHNKFYKLRDKIGLHGKIALDMACGSAAYSIAIADDYDHIYCIDRDSDALNLGATVAHSLHCLDKLHFFNANNFDFSSLYGQVDAIYCFEAMYLVGMKKFLRTAYKLLRPGGTFVFDIFCDGLYQAYFDSGFNDKYFFLMVNTTLRRIRQYPDSFTSLFTPSFTALVQGGDKSAVCASALEAGLLSQFPVIRNYDASLLQALQDIIFSCCAHYIEHKNMNFSMRHEIDRNEAFLPEELQAICAQAGFNDIELITLNNVDYMSGTRLERHLSRPCSDGDTYKGMPTIRFVAATKFMV